MYVKITRVARNTTANGIAVSIHAFGSTVFLGTRGVSRRGSVAKTAIKVAAEITIKDLMNDIPYFGVNDPNAAKPKSTASPIDGIRIMAGSRARSISRSIG